MDNHQRILILDMHLPDAEALKTCLTQAGYETFCLEDSSKLRGRTAAFLPELLVMDPFLPDGSGFELCRYMRTYSAIPVLMLSEKCDAAIRAEGLYSGADDYMSKPWDAEELCARVHALLRRSQLTRVSGSPGRVCKLAEHPGLIVNLTNYTVLCGHRYLDMPPKELELLFSLASEPNRVFTREQLLDLVWGYEYAGDVRTVDVHIKRIREKLGVHREWSVSTVWGVGYKFSVPAAQEAGPRTKRKRPESG